jgi:membrane-bound lytic murein transglycosylase MltF
MDWLLMMAQGYQEFRLDQHLRSPVGGIRVMQVKQIHETNLLLYHVFLRNRL